MNALFDAIVQALYYVCDKSGLSYPEINILIYCLLIPASWMLIVWLRSKRGALALMIHLLLPVLYYFERQHFISFSRQFYSSNISALEWLGEKYKTGYVGVSLVAGVLFPVLMYGLLFVMPKRYLLWVYSSFIVMNAIYYTWVLVRF